MPVVLESASAGVQPRLQARASDCLFVDWAKENIKDENERSQAIANHLKPGAFDGCHSGGFCGKERNAIFYALVETDAGYHASVFVTILRKSDKA
jgi:hypothetical protein